MLNKKIKISIIALVFLTCTLVIFATLPIEKVAAGSHNQRIENEMEPRETKHPAVDAIDDDVYSSYTAEDTANNVWQIFLSKSTNTGQNWQPVGWVGQRLHGPEYYEQDFSDIFIDQVTGRVHIVWQELLPYNPNPPYTNWAIWYTYYDPGPDTWRQFDVRFTVGNTYDAMYPKVAVDGPIGDQQNRFVHVCWQDDSSGQWEVRYTESPDGGDTWLENVYTISENDNTPSIHPVLEVDFDDNGFPKMQYVNFAWEQDNSINGGPSQIYIYYGIYNPYDELALRYEGVLNPTAREQTHPDISADLDEIHFVWVEDTEDINDPWFMGNVWLAHDSLGFDNKPPDPTAQNPVEILMVTQPGHLCHDLVDGDSWGPAMDFDVDLDPEPPGNNYLAIAYTAYEDVGSTNTELWCDHANGIGANYGWNVGPPASPTRETTTPNDYEHYPDVAVEPGYVTDPEQWDTFAHIVYDRCNIPFPPPYWDVWYIREP